MEEWLIVLLIGAVLLGGPLLALILAIVAFVRTRKLGELTRRVAELEARVRETGVGSAAADQARPASSIATDVASRDSASEIVSAEIVPEGVGPAVATPAHAIPPVSVGGPSEQPVRESFRWETFIGQKAFGWLAVLLFIFTAAFFLRYAYQNNWIGPVGRVAVGELAGVALVILGWRYHRQGWRRFSTMLSAAGIVVLYLATYSAFGFYRLLPQQYAGAFLAVLVVESMIAAVIYRSAIVALVAVLGGLLTPILMVTERDAYSALFMYLTVLNVGVVVALWMRSWAAVGSVTFLGTHGLFWMWYVDNYHPEKFWWALGFQSVLFGLYLTHSVVASLVSQRKAGWEELVRFVLNAILGFAVYNVLTRDDYRIWLGTAAISMATLYAIVGRITLASRPRDGRLLLTSLAVAVGFVAWSFPIQANVRWVSFGWAAMGAALWWFGQRVSAPMLRIMAGVLAAAAVVRLLMIDLPTYTRNPFIPIFNGFALPSLGVAICILFAVIVTDRFLSRLPQVERFLVGVAAVTGVLLVWLVLSFDCYGYFDSQSIGSTDFQQWRWRGQLALTVLWTAYASALLVLGFRLQRARLRWLAMVLFGVTVVKLFLVDMANVQQLYRILAFFVLAVVLGLVARVYQRFRSSPV